MDLKLLSPLLIDRMPVAIVILDEAARILVKNPEFERMFGVTGVNDDIAFGEFVEQGALGSFLQDMAALVKREITQFEATCRYVVAGEHRGWMHARFVTLNLQSTGEPLYYALIEDVSGHIDETVRLRKEKDVAEQATRSKSAFLANMSHEIRTPIHTVTGMAELLLETQLDDEQREYIKQIRFSAEVLLGIINDILDFSKIEAGKLNLEIIDFDLPKAIEDAVDMQSLEAFRKGLEIVLSSDARLPAFVKGDPVRLRQIITNLIANAIKFTSRGEVLIRVRVVGESADSLSVHFEVIDTGIGIPEEKQVLLFQAFSQVDASMTRRFGGTGLGLSICLSLVHMMHGEIGVKSTPGKGSNFWFKIPVPVAHRQSPPVFELDACADLKVLIVDDNAASRRVCRDAISTFCGSILEAENGSMGLSMLRNAAENDEPFDFALVDLTMPGMDGWQFASEVNSDKSINGTRMFLMSPPGSMGGEAKMKLLRWFDDYVSKPIKRGELLTVLSRVLSDSMDLGVAEAIEDDGNEQTPAEPLRPLPSVEPIKRQLKILVAEDHFVNQKLFQTILERLGHKALGAPDGKTAVDLGLAQSPDLIFMDVQMPVMNGYEATQALRQSGYRGPIIAVTANALKGDMEKCLQAGMDDYLSKPFQRQDVERVISTWVKNGDSIQGEEPQQNVVQKSHTAVTNAINGVETDDSIFDGGKALDVFMGDRRLLQSVLSDYLRTTPDAIERLGKALQSGDAKQAMIEAHTIKGSAWNLSAKSLGDSALPIEKACEQSDLSKARLAFPELMSEWERFTKTVASYLSQG